MTKKEPGMHRGSEEASALNEIDRMRNGFSSKLRNFLLRYGSTTALIIIIITFSIMLENFATLQNAMTIFRQISVTALIATGATYALILGGVDMSISALPGIGGSVVGVMLANGYNNVLSVVVALLVSAAFGLANGLLSTTLNIPFFLTGLAISWIARGVDLTITKYQLIYQGIRGNQSFLWLGRGYLGSVPVIGIIAAMIMLLTHVLMTQTRIGRNMYAIGGSPDGAASAGINLRKYRIWGLVACSFFAGMAGVLLTSRAAVATTRAGEGLMFDALLAAVFGTTVFTGGVPHILGTAVGVIFTGVLMNGLTQLAVNQFYQEVIKGVLILGAVGLSALGGKVLKVDMK